MFGISPSNPFFRRKGKDGPNKTKAIYLVCRQDPEGSHNLVSSVSVSGFSGHEVDEGLEGDGPRGIGVHQQHYTGKLHLSLFIG